MRKFSQVETAFELTGMFIFRIQYLNINKYLSQSEFPFWQAIEQSKTATLLMNESVSPSVLISPLPLSQPLARYIITRRFNG